MRMCRPVPVLIARCQAPGGSGFAGCSRAVADTAARRSSSLVVTDCAVAAVLH
jgi:hypothetical protein